ncbi:hypothetical protein LVJ82_05510 [Vitreoscilla massiliensis]|uniref:Hydrolase n=1 Tax=Vitreoscilla massiliensis TaxID=1689272 RepID=A0ABY4E6B8_9NEIS|nr:hypothetical protein [Vitreoscilla massiliensis]UOO90435.1 hypothetical protein LVJ82_05510 [Vitreoscilla massiliensis]
MTTILLDFDGTCVAHEYPYVGDDIGAQQVLHDLVANGHQLILFTMRSPINYLDFALAWFEENRIPLYGIQSHPEQKTWTASPKAYGQLIIDDTMLGAKLVDGRYLNWQWTAEMLCERGLITPAQLAAYDFSLYVY